MLRLVAPLIEGNEKAAPSAMGAAKPPTRPPMLFWPTLIVIVVLALRVSHPVKILVWFYYYIDVWHVRAWVVLLFFFVLQNLFPAFAGR